MSKEQILTGLINHFYNVPDKWERIKESFSRKSYLELVIYRELTLVDRNDFPTSLEEAIHIIDNATEW